MRNCVICGNEKEWENLDEYRDKPVNMRLCLKCGMIQIDRFKSLDEMFNHYQGHDYRKPPNSGNYHSGNLKLQYHMHFLKEYFDKWKDKEVNICDVGAAYGMFLGWCGQVLPKAKLYGTEWTESYVRNAYWEYGLRLTKEIDTSVKYDMISLYKTAEHIYDINEKMQEYRKCLKDDGYLYYSVPEWFGILSLFGEATPVQIDTYFHPDHINAWSHKHSLNILKKNGFKVIKEDHTLYNATYMCVKTDEPQELEYEDPNEIRQKVATMKKAIELMSQRKPAEAAKLWPNYPEAWMNGYEMQRKELHAAGEEEIEKYLNDAIKACPDVPEIHIFAGEIYRRYKKFEKAGDHLEKALALRPNAPNIIKAIAMLHHDIGANTNDLNCFFQARQAYAFLRDKFLNEFNQSVNWIYGINAALPIPPEKENENKHSRNM